MQRVWTSSVSLTFNKELSGALLLSHHTAIRGVIGQGAVVDGEVAHAADALEDVPWRDGLGVGGDRRCWKHAAKVVSFALANLLAWVSMQGSSSLAWRMKTDKKKKDASAFAAPLKKSWTDSFSSSTRASPSRRMNFLSVLQPFHFHIWIGDLDGQLDLMAFCHLVSRIQLLEEGCVSESSVF